MHVLTVGNSFTGKSWLNKRIATEQAARGDNIIVFDPLSSGGWPESAVKFSSPEKFIAHVKKAQSAHVFIDEAKVLWDSGAKLAKEADKTLYNRRHQGLLVYLIAQRTMMVPPNARNQCSRVFAFRQTKTDADILAAEFNEVLQNVRQMPDGEFIAVRGLAHAYGKLDFSEMPPLYSFSQ